MNPQLLLAIASGALSMAARMGKGRKVVAGAGKAVGKRVAGKSKGVRGRVGRGIEGASQRYGERQAPSTSDAILDAVTTGGLTSAGVYGVQSLGREDLMEEFEAGMSMDELWDSIKEASKASYMNDALKAAVKIGEYIPQTGVEDKVGALLGGKLEQLQERAVQRKPSFAELYAAANGL